MKDSGESDARTMAKLRAECESLSAFPRWDSTAEGIRHILAAYYLGTVTAEDSVVLVDELVAAVTRRGMVLR